MATFCESEDDKDILDNNIFENIELEDEKDLEALEMKSQRFSIRFSYHDNDVTITFSV